MSIKSHITLEDYTAFLKHVARSVSVSSGSRTVRMFIAMTVGFGIGLALSLLHISLRPSILGAMLFGAFAGAFILMAGITSTSRRQMQRMRPLEDGYILGAQETSLEEEGIQQCSEYHNAIFRWSLIRHIAVTDQHVFVMLDRVAGIILPKRAFSSDAERDEFVSEIERRSGKTRA